MVAIRIWTCLRKIETGYRVLRKGASGVVFYGSIAKMDSVIVIIYFSNQHIAAETEDCVPTRCRKHGPLIQFPFRNKEIHHQYCGYPGFDVHCDDKNETVLELPFSVKVIVKKIDYISQTIHLYDPDGCLLEKRLHLNLSASLFHFPSYLFDETLILFNCSGPGRFQDASYYSVQLVPCLSKPGYQLYAIRGNLDSYSVISCTLIHHIFPWDPSAGVLDNKIQLNWTEPACWNCEAQGKRCSYKNYTIGHEIQCKDKPKRKQGASNVPLVAASGSFLFLTTVVALLLVYKSIKRGKENQKKIEEFLEDYRALKPTRFSYSDITRITNQFNEKLGEGGYGIVYKGKLSDEIDVAVKVLNHSKEDGEEFVNEVGTIGRIHHVNVVRLVGFCAEGYKRALVYEFLPNESLEKVIFSMGSKKRSLGWQKLQDIALGIAKGIEYLHQGCDQRILHFDIKPHNILLDHNFNPKVCDFGLAKLCSKEKSAVTMTAARGTMGYIAPEVLSRTFGRVSYKSDVYSFGMLLLEMVGGRKNMDLEANTSRVYFPQFIYDHLNLDEDLWVHIEDTGDGNIARKLSIVGLWCIRWYPNDRPSMKQAIQMLEGDGHGLTIPPNPFEAVGGRPRYEMELPLILESKEDQMSVKCDS